MSEKPWQRDLPALRVDDLDLPALLPMNGPQHEPAIASYPGWSNLASQLHINTLATHPLDGTIWLATPGGVLRWAEDQSVFTRYASEHGFPGNAVAHIAIDTSGRIWAASEASVSYLNGDTWQPYFYIKGQPIHCMKGDNAGAVYVAAGDNLYTLTSPHSMPAVTPLPLGTPPRALAVTRQQGIWLCNARGLYHWEIDHWQSRLLQPNLLALEITHQYIWAGTTSGLVCIDLTKDEPCYSAEWPGGTVTALAVAFRDSYPRRGKALSPPSSSYQKPWAGTSPRPYDNQTPTIENLAVGHDEVGVWASCGGKLGLATPTGWKMLLNYTYISKIITCLAPAHQSTLWIGTSKGLFTASPTEVRKCVTDSPPDVIGLLDQKKPTSTFCNMVQALAVQQLAKTSLLWIGTASHLYCLDLTTEHWKRFASFHDVRACVPLTNTGLLLVASWGEGLYSLREKSQAIHIPVILPPVLALCQGMGNTHWAASLDGLYKTDGIGWELVLSSQELGSSNWIQALVQTTPEQLWLGTNAGLFTYQPTKRILEPVLQYPQTDRGNEENQTSPPATPFVDDSNRTTPNTSSHWTGASGQGAVGTPLEVVRVPTSPYSLDGFALGTLGIRALLVGSHADNETLWIGTECGLYRLQPMSLQAVPALSDMDIGITALSRDEETQTVWVGTEQGLLRLHDHDNQCTTEQYTTQNSGLAANHITALAHMRDDDGSGRLWIGTTCGLSCFKY